MLFSKNSDSASKNTKGAKLARPVFTKIDGVFLLSLLLLFLVNIVYLLKNADIDYDEAVYSQIAKSILNGQVPYRDFSLFKTYLYPYALSFIFLVGGEGFSQVRVASMVFEALTLIGIYLLGKEVKNNTLGLIAAAVYAASYFPIMVNNSGKAETLFNIFLVFSIYFLIKWRREKTMKSLVVSALLLSFAFLTLPRGVIFALAAFVAALVVVGEWKNSAVFLAFFCGISMLFCVPFLIVAPTNFILEVFLFNMVRVQPATGLASSVEWLIRHGSLTLIILGTIGTIMYAYSFAVALVKSKSLKSLEIEGLFFNFLLVLLYIFFLAGLILSSFTYPYMFYPIWPILSLGTAFAFQHALAFRKNNLRLSNKSKIKLLSGAVLLGILAGTIFFDSYSISSAVERNLSEANTEYRRLKEVADFIEAHTNPSERILSTIPSLAFIANRDFVLSPRPYGGSLDLINYLHFKAFVTIYENYTQGNVLSRLLLARDIINDVQKSIEGREVLSLLIQARVVVVATTFLEYHIPGYNDVVRPVIVANGKLVGVFETLHYGPIEVYVTNL